MQDELVVEPIRVWGESWGGLAELLELGGGSGSWKLVAEEVNHKTTQDNSRTQICPLCKESPAESFRAHSDRG